MLWALSASAGRRRSTPVRRSPTALSNPGTRSARSVRDVDADERPERLDAGERGLLALVLDDQVAQPSGLVDEHPEQFGGRAGGGEHGRRRLDGGWGRDVGIDRGLGAGDGAGQQSGDGDGNHRMFGRCALSRVDEYASAGERPDADVAPLDLDGERAVG